MPRLHLFGLLSALLLFQGCGRADVTVAADITLNPVMDSIANEFTANTGITVDITYGESGTIQTEIIEGSEYDIFIPLGVQAAIRYGNKKVEISDIDNFAEAEIVLLTTHKLRDPDSFPTYLLNPDVKRIGVCDRKNSEVYRYCSYLIKDAFSDRGKSYNEIYRKYLSVENNSLVISMVQSGDADAGIVTLSTLIASGQAKKVNWINLSKLRHKFPTYMLFMMGKLSSNKADAFQKFLLSPETEKWLERYHIHRKNMKY